MTDDATTIFQGRNGSEGQSWISRPPKEPASISMLNLARANLKVKLYSIAETSLSEHQKQIYATVKEMLNAPTEVSAITEDRGWDGIYQAESSIALLYNGERLRQEVDACLQDLTNLNKAEAHTLRLDYQRLVKHAVDGSTLGANDTTLSVYLLRLMEGVHWNKKKMYVVHELYSQATRRILWCILERFPFILNRGGFPESCQCASLSALIRFGGNNAEALFDGLA